MNKYVRLVCGAAAATGILAGCSSQSSSTPAPEVPKANTDPSKGWVKVFPDEEPSRSTGGYMEMRCQGGNLIYSQGYNTLAVSPRDPQCPQPKSPQDAPQAPR